MIKARIAVFLFTVIILAIFGSIAILYARGYRLGLREEKISISTRGLLVINSDPTGAQVFVDNELKTATNNTISLIPGTYNIQVKKEGFLPWEKLITIEKETVTQIDAFLVQLAPSLTALTFSGAFSPTLSPDFSKISYGVPTNSDNEEKAGLWVLETVNLPLGFNKDARRITDGNLLESSWEWSPDGREILLTTKNGVFLLDTSIFTPQTQRVNVASRVEEIRKEWDAELAKRETSKLTQLPDEIEKVFKQHATNIKFSPDENRILYTAESQASIPTGLVKPLPGSSTQAESRNLKEGASYVYDIKEDKNFLVGNPGENLSWLSNSLNLLLPSEDKISILDYDGTNKQVVFTGNYEYPHAYPSTSSNRILLLTNFGGESVPNLYWLSLK